MASNTHTYSHLRLSNDYYNDSAPGAPCTVIARADTIEELVPYEDEDLGYISEESIDTSTTTAPPPYARNKTTFHPTTVAPQSAPPCPSLSLMASVMAASAPKLSHTIELVTDIRKFRNMTAAEQVCVLYVYILVLFTH